MGLRKRDNERGNILGYVSGIFGLGPSPKYLRIGGATNIVTGPIEPITIE